MQDQDNQKNLLLAIVLSVSVLLFWQLFYAGPKLKEEQERRQRSQQQQTQVQPGAPKAAPEAVPGSLPTAQQQSGTVPSLATPALTRAAAIEANPRVRIETPSLKGSVALKGGRVDDLVLVRYHEAADIKSPNVVLFSPSGSPEPYYAEYGWVAAAGAAQPVPDRDTLWRAEAPGPLTPAAPLTLAWDNGKGLLFKRRIAIDADYLITVTDEVENKGSAEVSLFPYALISRHGMPKVQGYYILHEGLIGVLGDAGLKEITYADVLKDGGSKSFKQTGGWFGMTDKYWAAALIPDQKAPYDAELSGVKGGNGAKDRFQTGYALNAVAIPPGASRSTTSNLFAGAKQMTLIEAYGEKLGAKQFDLLIDWGWFFFITKPLFKLLHWLSQLLGNYGLAILATTVLVKLAFFPLANKSYESMAKMKKLQPEMEKIRDRFKEDRVRQQQELMALYKNEKINPMAGCLPIALQIPVFFALYKVLFVTIDMRHAPFYGWIKDLSAPDPTSLFNLFGLLPFATPEFLQVGVWPLIMGVTMWVQMQLNPQQPDPVQQKIFNWMPVIFTFMLASFPSGLVIYWAWNNVLSLLQQYAIMRKNNTEIHLWKNLGVDKWQARFAAAKASGGGNWKERVGSLKSSLPQQLGKALKRGDAGADKTAAASSTMTREQALRTLGLKSDASEAEIDAALEQKGGERKGMNGSDHAIAAKINEAREILRGKEGS
ncbi:MAG: membrane protein insertase YidC [Hyphomicrobiaceae bacterium]|nr:MAG: membrane protein insertase YidC [Hyphomicrobiaceae bacterium]